MNNSMKKIIIQPYSAKLRNGELNPKNYNKWAEVVEMLNFTKIYDIIQIGINDQFKIPGIQNFFFNQNMSELRKLLISCDTWISVDSFLPHMAHYYKINPGIVIFGISDPNIFGYKENINLIKDRKYLRKEQYQIWDCVKYDPEVFVEPQVVVDAVFRILS